MEEHPNTTSTQSPDDDALNEALSACMDGDVERHAQRFVVKRLCDDDEVANRWSRYHVARAVLQRDALINCDVSDRVKQATRDLPVPEAPKKMPALVKPIAGGVIAASVAVAAVLSLNQAGLQSTGGGMDNNPGFVSQSTPMDRVFNQPATPVGLEPTIITQDRKRLERLLLQHQQATRGAGIGTYWPVVTMTPATPQTDQNPPPQAPENQ